MSGVTYRYIALILLLMMPVPAFAQSDEGGVEETPADVSEAPATISTIEINGRIREAGSRDPLESVIVSVAGTDLETETDAEGRFHLEALPAGAITLKIAMPGYQGRSVDLILQEGKSYQVNQFLFPREDRAYAMTVETRRESENMTEHSISIEEASRVPGTLGDVVRSVQNMPGVARSPYSLGVLIIRGASPFESGYFLEGMQLPNLYHFLGVKAALNGDLLDRIDYIPGGYGVRYGRMLGGIVNLELKDMFSGPVHGYAEIDLIDSTFYLQGTVGKKFSYAASATRSYVDLVLEPFISKMSGYQIRAPQYWDTQLRLGYQPSTSTQLNLLLMASSDKFAVLGQYRGEDDEDYYEDREPTAELATKFSRVLFQGTTRLSERLTHDFLVAAGPDNQYYKYGPTYVSEQPWNFSLRDEWEYVAGKRAKFTAGVDFVASRYLFDLTIPNSSLSFEEEPSMGYSPSPYLELEWSLTPGLKLFPGVRVDPLWVPAQDYSAISVDPRLALRWNRSTKTEFNASAGQYSQFPDPTEFFDELGSPDLTPTHAWQFVVGAKQHLSTLFWIGGNLYYNYMRDLVTEPTIPYVSIEDFVLDPDAVESLEIAPYSNDGLGRAYGLELLIRRHFGGRLFGWLSYTLNRAERKASKGDDWYLFDYDQTHVLTLVGSYELARGWTAGLRFMFTTGSPYTPYSNRIFLVDTEGYVPLNDPDLGLNYERLAPYHVLDLRVDRKFVFKRWSLELWLELQNAYNRGNIETWYYPYDYGEKLWIYGLPIFPDLGVKGAF